MFSLLLSKVDWAMEPSLARAIRSGTKIDKSDSIHNTRDGHAFYAALQRLADRQMSTKWRSSSVFRIYWYMNGKYHFSIYFAGGKGSGMQMQNGI